MIQHTLFTTFDDNTTQSAVRFLLRYREATKDSRHPRDLGIEESLERGLRGMLRAQYPNGAWPQRYGGEPRDPAVHPVKKAAIPKDYPRTWPDADYTRFYTLNDNVQSTCVQTMLLAHGLRGRAEYLESGASRRGFPLAGADAGAASRLGAAI